MKYDAGVDLRFFIRKAVVRIGVAGSDETIQVVAMFGQPFLCESLCSSEGSNRC